MRDGIISLLCCSPLTVAVVLAAHGYPLPALLIVAGCFLLVDITHRA